jgi:hypothetical protein
MSLVVVIVRGLNSIGVSQVVSGNYKLVFNYKLIYNGKGWYILWLF